MKCFEYNNHVHPFKGSQLFHPKCVQIYSENKMFRKFEISDGSQRNWKVDTANVACSVCCSFDFWSQPLFENKHYNGVILWVVERVNHSICVSCVCFYQVYWKRVIKWIFHYVVVVAPVAYLIHSVYILRYSTRPHRIVAWRAFTFNYCEQAQNGLDGEDLQSKWLAKSNKIT